MKTKFLSAWRLGPALALALSVPACSPTTIDLPLGADTEVLIDQALEKLHGLAAPKVLDLGTGSGIIAISLIPVFIGWLKSRRAPVAG